MRQFFSQVLHHYGTGRALENARHERDETARALAGITALEARFAALDAAPAADPVIAA